MALLCHTPEHPSPSSLPCLALAEDFLLVDTHQEPLAGYWDIATHKRLRLPNSSHLMIGVNNGSDNDARGPSGLTRWTHFPQAASLVALGQPSKGQLSPHSADQETEAQRWAVPRPLGGRLRSDLLSESRV